MTVILSSVSKIIHKSVRRFSTTHDYNNNMRIYVQHASCHRLSISSSNFFAFFVGQRKTLNEGACAKYNNTQALHTGFLAREKDFKA